MLFQPDIKIGWHRVSPRKDVERYHLPLDFIQIWLFYQGTLNGSILRIEWVNKPYWGFHRSGLGDIPWITTTTDLPTDNPWIGWENWPGFPILLTKDTKSGVLTVSPGNRNHRDQRRNELLGGFNPLICDSQPGSSPSDGKFRTSKSNQFWLAYPWHSQEKIYPFDIHSIANSLIIIGSIAVTSCYIAILPPLETWKSRCAAQNWDPLSPARPSSTCHGQVDDSARRSKKTKRVF